MGSIASSVYRHAVDDRLRDSAVPRASFARIDDSVDGGVRRGARPRWRQRHGRPRRGSPRVHRRGAGGLGRVVRAAGRRRDRVGSAAAVAATLIGGPPGRGEDHGMGGGRTGPLSHLRVLDLSRMYPGAYATQLLADLGADVWKVEAPKFGDGMRFLAGGGFEAAHVALNRGKRSLTLDLRQPGAADVLRRLVRDADVVVESHRPGALDAQGIGYAQLSAENPRLVWCALTGFGQTGPNAQAPGHDITYLGAAGALSRLSAPSVAPTPPQLTFAVPMGALMGVTGILAALARARPHGPRRVRRRQPHRRRHVGGERGRRRRRGRAGAELARHGRALGVRLRGRRVGHRRRDRGEVVGRARRRARPARSGRAPARGRRAGDHRAPRGGVRDQARGGVAREPRLRRRRRAVLRAGRSARRRARARPRRHRRPSTALASVCSPTRCASTDPTARPTSALSPAPDLGAHTDELLAAAGFTAAEVASLRDAGII